jgi:hypothetical protein
MRISAAFLGVLIVKIAILTKRNAQDERRLARPNDYLHPLRNSSTPRGVCIYRVQRK